MENLKLPAYPGLHSFTGEDGKIWTGECEGFTKLELASLMIAQGLSQREWADPYNKQKELAISAVELAKAVLEEANK